MRSPHEIAVYIPVPPHSRPGAAAPWLDRSSVEGIGALDRDEIRARLAGVMAPVPPGIALSGRSGDPSSGFSIPSAVLVPLISTLTSDGRPELAIVFGKRSSALPSHRGDLSFPGGRFQPGVDTDLQAAALREANEEMAIDPGAVDVLGTLDPLGTMVSRFLIAPFVGFVDAPASSFAPRDGEFDRVLVVPATRLLEPGVYRQEIWSGLPPPMPERGPRDPQGSDGERAVNFYAVDGWDVIWGATATILTQLLDALTRD